MYHYTYRIDHASLGYFYFGVRSSRVLPADDNYFGSSRYLTALMLEHPGGWAKTVLSEHPTRPEAAAHEHALITPEAVGDPLCINRTRGGKSWRSEANLPLMGQAISRALKGKPKSAEHNAAVAKALTGLPFTPERCQNISKANKGRKYGKRSPETLALLSLRRKEWWARKKAALVA